MSDTATRQDITLHRMGDFLEAFDADAQTIAAVLGLTLTTREERKLAGFLANRTEYLARLSAAGFQVAIVNHNNLA